MSAFALLLSLLEVPAGRPPAACPAGMALVPAAEAFCLDLAEVTVADYRRCVDRGDCTPAAKSVAVPGLPEGDVELWSRSCNAGREGRDEHPINCVDFRQASDFCAAAGGRLPTEEEWQFAAAGGGEERRYPWGGDRPSARLLNVCEFDCLDRLRLLDHRRPVLHYGEDGFADTAPVGSFPAGAGRWGHLDLAGNVWELTASTWGGDDRLRVMRGGGWAQTDRRRIETGYRAGFPKTARGSAVGFRCATSPPSQAPGPDATDPPSR